MQTRAYYPRNLIYALALFIAAVCTSSRAVAADKFATFGNASFVVQPGFFLPSPVRVCPTLGEVLTAKVALRNFRGIAPRLLDIGETSGRTIFRYAVSTVDDSVDIDPVPPRTPFVLEAYRSYLDVTAGEFEIAAIQATGAGDRLADAVRYRLTRDYYCPSVKSVAVVSGDMQVVAVGSPFPSPMVGVRVTDKAGNGARDASVALALEAPVVEAMTDTGIDGPKSAVLADASGQATFALTAGNKVGVKRFVVKARGDGTASAMATLMYVPAGAVTANSAPVIEYAYDGGSA